MGMPLGAADISGANPPIMRKCNHRMLPHVVVDVVSVNFCLLGKPWTSTLPAETLTKQSRKADETQHKVDKAFHKVVTSCTKFAILPFCQLRLDSGCHESC